MPHAWIEQLEFLLRRRTACLAELRKLDGRAAEFLALDLDARAAAVYSNGRQLTGAVAEIDHIDRLIDEIREAA